MGQYSICLPSGDFIIIAASGPVVNRENRKNRNFVRAGAHKKIGWSACFNRFWNGAADEARTRYLHLGKVALYQMSYGRIKKSPRWSVIFLLAAPVRLERTTPWLTVRCSNQLSYGAITLRLCQTTLIIIAMLVGFVNSFFQKNVKTESNILKNTWDFWENLLWYRCIFMGQGDLYPLVFSLSYKMLPL